MKPCTCRPDDKPPVPCAQQYAFSDCMRADRDSWKAVAESYEADRLEQKAKIERLLNVIPVWMTAHGYATGHGDTIEDMLGELEAQAMKRGEAQ